MTTQIESVSIYPVFNHAFQTSEHPEGEQEHLGDALGKDFIAMKFHDGFPRTYLNDGHRNEDWFGYGMDVLAPCDAIVERINILESENEPGSHINKPSGSVTFLCANNIRISYAHLTDITVKPNDKVVAGQAFSKCGNNGTSWCPHVHVGAWRDNEPLQISVDLAALGKIQREMGDAFYFITDDDKTKTDFHESFTK